MTAHKSRSSFNTDRTAGTIMVSCLGAAGVGLFSLLFWPISAHKPTADTTVQIDVEPESSKQLSGPLDAADVFIGGDPSLSKEVLPAQMGTVPNLEALSQPDSQGIEPTKTQAEQGLDDGSGLTYPCVFSPDSPDVCQRKLTVAEAKERGLF